MCHRLGLRHCDQAGVRPDHEYLPRVRERDDRVRVRQHGHAGLRLVGRMCSVRRQHRLCSANARMQRRDQHLRRLSREHGLLGHDARLQHDGDDVPRLRC